MDPYYSYRHFKEEKNQRERQTRVYQEYLRSLLDQEDSKRSGYYSLTRAIYTKPRRQDFTATAKPKPAVPEDGYWITSQQDAKNSFKEASAKLTRKKKAEETPRPTRFRGLRPGY